MLLHRRFSWQAEHLVRWRRCCFHESQCQGCANMTQCQKSAFCECLEKWRKLRKQMLLELCKNSFIRKTRRKSSIFTSTVSKLERVSQEMVFLALQTLKLGGHSFWLFCMTGAILYKRINRVAESRVSESSRARVARVAES